MVIRDSYSRREPLAAFGFKFNLRQLAFTLIINSYVNLAVTVGGGDRLTQETQGASKITSNGVKGVSSSEARKKQFPKWAKTQPAKSLAKASLRSSGPQRSTIGRFCTVGYREKPSFRRGSE